MEFYGSFRYIVNLLVMIFIDLWNCMGLEGIKLI